MSLTAWPIDGYSSDAEVIRQMQGSLIGSAGGLVAGGGLTLTQKGTPNMSVQILGGTPAEGGLWVPGYTTTTGPYYFQNSATYEQVIETAGASFPRIDTIVARIYDNAVDGLGKKEPVFEALKGAEESGVTLGNKKGAHAAVKNTYILGYVLVPAKASSIVTADIENVASQFGLSTAQRGLSTFALATEQSRENTAYGTLPTPDEVTVTVPEGGLLVVAYKAIWSSSVSAAGKAAIFIGANQLKAPGTGAPEAANEAVTSVTTPHALETIIGGLAGAGAPATSVVATGEALSAVGTGGGPLYIRGLPAGTYPVSIRFKASSGNVKVFDRQLWAWTVG